MTTQYINKQLLVALKELRDAYQEFMGLPACKANAAIARTLDVVRIALYGGDGNGGGTEAFPAAVKALHELRAEEAAQAAAQKGGEA